MSGDLSKISWMDVERRVAAGTLAVLAIGACEQHGAHLPLTTDTDMAHGVAGRIAATLDAFLLPPITYGDAWTAQTYPGTISISPRTLQAMLEDIGHSILRSGVKGLILVNGHFGNREPMLLAARQLSEAGLPVCHLDYPGLETLAEKHCDSTPAGPGFYHADEVETSFMLALRPEAVRMDLASPQYPEFPKSFGAEPMQMRDFNPTGVFGDPRPATAEKGEAIISGVVQASLDLVHHWRTHHSI
jgi:creatinine amidohydrolase